MTLSVDDAIWCRMVGWVKRLCKGAFGLPGFGVVSCYLSGGIK